MYLRLGTDIEYRAANAIEREPDNRDSDWHSVNAACGLLGGDCKGAANEAPLQRLNAS